MNRSRTYSLTLCSILLATALVLAFFESLLIPSLPALPGAKLGLSNIVTLFSLYTLSPIATLVILLLRIILASFFGGGITGLLFSFTGGALAFFAMLFLKKFKTFSIYGVSILGAAIHSVGQILAAALMFSSFSIFTYLPIMLFISVFTGALVAFIAQFIISRTKMYKK